ncbi:hypothetical protein [Flavivirga jejuensis]|uniref:Peptide-N(4)-(N-acetyl-beta-glucosaminyl)asparagine amidase n=1 Tax=Flavivirga jejuensis TaxID=870487 RepID=A0ABT8WST6_9FLAO|nr:hypothetical protein [Flavivirga jejuensis]MDO5975926.1 hypothetical protein [Flavivirga jejuensis]
MMKYLYNYFFTFCTFLIISCSDIPKGLELALIEAGDNRPELEKVLNLYKVNPDDSLKYKAAVFLIKNMHKHASYKTIKGFEGAFDSIYNYPKSDVRREIFGKILDSVSKTISKKTELISDIKVLTSNFIIKNIELSFEAWKRIPKNKRASFDDFCNYILPYKSTNEPIEENSREKLFKKYKWVYNYLDKGASLRFVVDSITSEFGHINMTKIGKYYPVPLSTSQIEKSKLGLCDDAVNYLVNVFRAIGIICAKDMVLHWGNHPSFGHSWIYTRYDKEEYSTQVNGKTDLKISFKEESIPKVNRGVYCHQKIENTLSQFQQDVTAEYVPTLNIKIKNVFDVPNSLPLLCVFDINNVWKPIALGKYNGKENVYNNVGVNVLYMATNQENDNNIPVNYPFYIDNTKKVHFFKPNLSTLDSVSLTRKIGLSTPRNKSKINWIKSINGGVFQGSNKKDFNSAKTLYEITNFNSTHINTIKLRSKEKFKYVRFYSNKKESFLAKLAFYGVNGKLLTGTVYKKNNLELIWENGAFDDDPLSLSGGTDFSLGWKFKTPEHIDSIEFQVRNDDNHINIGEEYELFYWDKNWRSLGSRVAKDTVLYYNIPENSLLWLRNLTKGKEEHVFTIDKNKKQRWLGFDNDL